MRLGEILFTAEAIRRRVAELAEAIRPVYAQTTPHIISVMKGSIFFTADLIRALSLPVTVGCLIASSYREKTVSEGTVELLTQGMGEVAGRDVLVVDDIIDTGYTLAKIRQVLQAERPRSLRFCVFLDKVELRQVPFEVDFVGFTIRGGWVVGYGLDCAEEYRYLDCIRLVDLSDGKTLPPGSPP